jgi:hypothetical protein
MMEESHISVARCDVEAFELDIAAADLAEQAGDGDDDPTIGRREILSRSQR